MKMFAVLFLSISFFVSSTTSQPTTRHGTIRAYVEDAQTGDPLDQATVKITGTNQRAVTGSEGTATIKQIIPGTYSIEVRCRGYEKKILKNIRVGADSTIAIRVALEQAISQPGSGLFGISGESGVLFPQNGSGSAYERNSSLQFNYNELHQEAYSKIVENEFRSVRDNPLSTFSIDVDNASYSNIRRFINQGTPPPKDAVRVEEMINYFVYDYPQPKGEHPFAIVTELADCPWQKEHKLIHIGVKGKEIASDRLPPSNLVFLLDVSGSMQAANRLPLVQKSLRLLVDQLREQDKVAIVVYAGSAGLVLPPTSGADKADILEAIDRLRAGGSTAGGAGITLAYKTARENFLDKGNNRVILATDGDFNVGVTSDGELVRIIEQERESGVFLTVLGYGMGNYKDSKMEQLADKGNGNYGYIDNILEARKQLVKQMGGTLHTIAKDVKIQIEFNPAYVKEYRLIGYENRVLAKEDFNNDKKDAGELGAGHTVTALYEVIPSGVSNSYLDSVDALKYQSTNTSEAARASGELMTVKFRYKEPKDTVSKLITMPVRNADAKSFASASENLRFASSVIEFSMQLTGSKFKGTSTTKDVLAIARNAKGKDDEGYRAEFIRLVEMYELLDKAER